MTSAVVTGAAGGIGRAIAQRLAGEGWRLTLADVLPAVQDVAAAIGARAVVGDCSTEAGVARLVEAAGDVDVWFGNAGVDRGQGLGASEDDWASSLEVNVMAHVRAARLLVPRWIERGGGRYVLTASAAGLLSMVGSASYSVSKHGAVAFAEWLSLTYRHRGIVVQALCPQGVRTRMVEESAMLQQVLAHDGLLTPEQVADAVWEALQDERFLVLPHPQVADYYGARVADTDRWLAGMNRIARQVE